MNRLRFINRYLGIPQEQIARDLGVSQPMIHHYIKGQPIPPHFDRQIDMMIDEYQINEPDPRAQQMIDAIRAYGKSLKVHR